MTKSLHDPSACGLEPPPSALADQLELFSGSANPAEARVYAMATLSEKHRHELKQFKLSGHLIGPECEFAHTLSARMPFSDRSVDQNLLAEAIVPDPCFWTPELPFLYRAELQLYSTESVIEHHHDIVGIRRLGIRGRQLYFDAKRFVLRGTYRNFIGETPSDTELAFARQTWTAAIIAWPSKTLCEFASRRGMLVIADLRTVGTNASGGAVAGALRSLAQWPAVIMAIVDAQTLPLIELRGVVRNLLIAQYVRAEDQLVVEPQAQIIFAEVGKPADFALLTKNCDRPVVAVRRLAQTANIEQARAACDSLQGDLVPYGDFAAYIV